MQSREVSMSPIRAGICFSIFCHQIPQASLKPSPATLGRQTLGGLVSNCYIDGKIMKDPGDLDGDGIAVIPVKILAPV